MLDEWLRRRPLRNESRFSRTYVVCDGDRVLAYYCISAGGVRREAATAKLRRNAPGVVPVSVIGRLAVDRACAGKGLGADLLADALRRIALATQTIGITAVLVQAKDERAGVLSGVCGVHRVSGGELDLVAADRRGSGSVAYRTDTQ